MKAYSQDLRDRVISKYKSGKYRIKELAVMFNITRQTIGNWLKRYKETGDYSSRHHMQKGRAIKFNDRNKVLRYLETNCNANGITIRDNKVKYIDDHYRTFKYWDIEIDSTV